MSGALSAFFDSIKYWYDSKKGKYSLDTYLDIISEYADRQIIDAEENEHLEYLGGECQVFNSSDKPEIICFSVILFFIDKEGVHVKKEAKREIEITKFVRETKKIIENNELVFNIENPRRREK